MDLVGWLCRRTLQSLARRRSTTHRRYPPASPHRCVGCAPYSRVWRQRHGLKDCHTLCPDTGVGVPPQWAVVVPPQWRPGSPPTAWHRARLLPQPQCSRGRPLHPQGDFATSLAPIRGLCHSQSHATNSSHPSTRAPHIRCLAPTVDEWCCRPQALSAIGSIGKPEDDAVEHLPSALAEAWSSTAVIFLVRMIGSNRSSGTSQIISSLLFPHASFGETIRIVPETGQ